MSEKQNMSAWEKRKKFNPGWTDEARCCANCRHFDEEAEFVVKDWMSGNEAICRLSKIITYPDCVCDNFEEVE